MSDIQDHLRKVRDAMGRLEEETNHNTPCADRDATLNNAIMWLHAAVSELAKGQEVICAHEGCNAYRMKPSSHCRHHGGYDRETFKAEPLTPATLSNAASLVTGDADMISKAAHQAAIELIVKGLTAEPVAPSVNSFYVTSTRMLNDRAELELARGDTRKTFEVICLELETP